MQNARPLADRLCERRKERKKQIYTYFAGQGEEDEVAGWRCRPRSKYLRPGTKGWMKITTTKYIYIPDKQGSRKEKEAFEKNADSRPSSAEPDDALALTAVLQRLARREARPSSSYTLGSFPEKGYREVAGEGSGVDGRSIEQSLPGIIVAV